MEAHVFFPAWLGAVFVLCWFVLGALAGTVLGRVSARALGAATGQAVWPDAAAGAAGVLLVLGLALAVSGLDTVVIENGVTQGWRAVLLDHMLLWAAVAVCGAVLGRQVVAARRRPRAPKGAPPPVAAPGAPAGTGLPAA